MPLIASDTETGGFVPEKNALLSIGMVELTPDLLPTERRLHIFILPEPGFSVDEGAAKVNGYTPELWAERKAIPLKDAMQQVADWMPEKAEALAHNAPFDKSFIHHAEALTGIGTKMSRQWTCSCDRFRTVSRVLRIFTQNHKLATLAQLSGYVWGPDGAHSALEDALACAHGFRWLDQQMQPKAKG